MSEQRNGQIHIDEEDASGGSKEHVVRYVLGISLIAAIVLLSAIWIFGAATQGDAESEAKVTPAANEATSSDTDGVILESGE